MMRTGSPLRISGRAAPAMGNIKEIRCRSMISRNRWESSESEIKKIENSRG